MGRTLDFYDKVYEAGNDDEDEILIHDELLLVLRCFQLYVGLHCIVDCLRARQAPVIRVIQNFQSMAPVIHVP